VLAPTLITFGSGEGEPIVLVNPASPELTTTVMPAATAASLASLVRSTAVPGKGFDPNDSLMTLTTALARDLHAIVHQEPPVVTANYRPNGAAGSAASAARQLVATACHVRRASPTMSAWQV
jgi:hypothetical protein